MFTGARGLSRWAAVPLLVAGLAELSTAQTFNPSYGGTTLGVQPAPAYYHGPARSLVAGVPSYTREAANVLALRRAVEAALRSTPARWTALVTDGVGRHKLYALQPTRPSRPASNVKLVTSAAAWELLGPQGRFRGRPLASSLIPINSRSNNGLADALLLHLGGERVALRWAERNGVLTHGIRLRDGSGLNYDSRLSAVDLVRFLVLMRGRHPAWVETLAISGTRGTLGRRLGGPLKGRVKAKTGTLPNGRVAALSGYVMRPDGQVLVFSFVANDVDARAGHRAIDRAVRALFHAPGPLPYSTVLPYQVTQQTALGLPDRRLGQ